MNNLVEKLYEYYTYRHDSPDLTRTSICFLLPMSIRDDIREIKEHLYNTNPQVVAYHFIPSYPRKHITMFMTGSWKNLLQAKQALVQSTDDKLKKLKQV